MGHNSLLAQSEQGEQFRHITDFGMVSDGRISQLAPAVHPDNSHTSSLRTGKVGVRFVTNVSEFTRGHVRKPAGLLEHARMGFSLAC